MKLLTLPPVRINRDSLGEAFESVFGPSMLRRVHGPDTRVGNFEDNKRRFSFKVHVGEIPPLIRRFFCGRELKVTTQQRLSTEPTKWEVTNRMKLHFVGAEFVGIKPVFWLEACDGTEGREAGIYLGGTVRHDARFPPPLNGIAESFMIANSEKELRHFGDCLVEAGVIRPVATAGQQ